MRELEKLTGFSRATITFYIREGLLPTPEKSAKNMAYYDRDFIERLHLIQKLKDADLSISQMKHVLNSKNELNISPLLDTIRSVNKLLTLGPIDQPVTIQEIEGTGLADSVINELIKLSIILPLDPEGTLFPSYSVTICKLAKFFLDFGIPLSVVNEVTLKMKELIAMEMNAFHKYIKTQVNEKTVSAGDQEKAFLECLENINTLLPLLHLQFLKSEDPCKKLSES